jgi:hypothetical protein
MSDYFILDVVEGDDGVPAVHAATPSSVVMVTDADDLNAKLEAFADPFKNRVLPNTSKARLLYLTRYMPALRFYCKQFNVEVPDWLAESTQWEEMSDGEKQKKFGTTDLNLREFQPIKCPDIAIVREQQQ